MHTMIWDKIRLFRIFIVFPFIHGKGQNHLLFSMGESFPLFPYHTDCPHPMQPAEFSVYLFFMV